MKKILLSFALIIGMAVSASAQEAGEQTLGVSLGYQTSKTTIKLKLDNESEKTSVPGANNFGIALDYGYFVIDNLRVGASIGYGLDASIEDESIHSLKIMPNVSYYIRLADNFYYTPNLSLGFAMDVQHYQEEIHNVTISENESMYGFGAELQPLAIEFRPSPRFAMSVSLCSLQYTTLKYSNEEYRQYDASITRGDIAFKLLANAQVGFKLYF